MQANRTATFKLMLSFAGVLWLFLVVVGYYVVHKPVLLENSTAAMNSGDFHVIALKHITLQNALALINVVGDLVVPAFLYFLAGAVGRRVILLFGVFPEPERSIYGIGLGLGLVSFATLGLGLLGILNGVVWWLGALLLLVLFRGDLVGLWRARRSFQLPAASRREQALWAFVFLTLGASLLFALTPPVGWDGLQYHLILPKLALDNGRILPPPDNVSLNFPGLVEMLFLAAMRLKGDVAAQVMHWGFLPLLVAALVTFAWRVLEPRMGLLAASLLLAVPSFVVTATWAYNDVALSFYSWAALAITLRAREEGNYRLFLLAGLMAGLALGEKYTAVFVLVALTALVLSFSIKGLKQAALLGAAAIGTAAPWFLRNWAFTGNPVYPFLWGGPFWDGFRAAWYSRFGTGLASDPLRLLAIPWEATVIAREDTSNFQATIGPLLICLLVFWPLTWKFAPAASRHMRGLWAFSGIVYAGWLLGAAESKLLLQTRLLFPAFPALTLLAADGFERLAHIRVPALSLQRFSGLLVAFVFALTSLSYLLSVAGGPALAYLTGYQSREEYLAGTLGSYFQATEYINHNLPSNARLLTLWEPRSYYIERQVTADAILDLFPHLQYLYRDARSIAAVICDRGYTHILLNRAGLIFMLESQYDPVTSNTLDAIDSLTTRYARPVLGGPDRPGGSSGPLVAEQQDYELYEMICPVVSEARGARSVSYLHSSPGEAD